MPLHPSVKMLLIWGLSMVHKTLFTFHVMIHLKNLLPYRCIQVLRLIPLHEPISMFYQLQRKQFSPLIHSVPNLEQS